MALGGSSVYGGNVDSVMMDVDDGYREGENTKGRAASGWCFGLILRANALAELR
jgi:hypothetical protein